MRLCTVHCMQYFAVFLCGCFVSTPPDRSEIDQGRVRQVMAKLVAVGDKQNHARAERMRVGAELAAAVGTPDFREVAAVVGMMVEELAASGAARTLEDEFRTNEVYPVVQVACDIDDAELFAALLPYLALPSKDTRRDIATRITVAARFDRVVGRAFPVIRDMLRHALVPRDPADPNTWRVLQYTLHDPVAALWTWQDVARISPEQARDLAARLQFLASLGTRVGLLRDEAAAVEGREVLLELAGDESWLVRAIVRHQIAFNNAFYDPQILERLLERAEPFQRAGLEGIPAAREAQGLPGDRATSVAESRLPD